MTDLTVTSDAHRQLVTESQLATDGNETGGILLGRDLGMGRGFLVCHCGGPGPDAVRQPAHFRRDLAYARALADHAAATDGSVWIGEWHTHLVELPVPSPHDLRTYRSLLLDREIAFPRVLSLIVLAGASGLWSHPQIFGWSISLSSIRRLTVTVEAG
jgi:integrative and conjugative element protein (TIGR02256 family)